jgi:hypothetical protein
VAIPPALALVAGTAMGASADPRPNRTYMEAVQQAYDIVNLAAPSDPRPAAYALAVLIDGTGSSQPEIIDDLKARPPLYDDARSRLAALLTALVQPITTTDPALAQQRLHQVMSQSRYDALHRPPSALDRLVQWIQDRIAQFLSLLFGPRAGGQPAVQIWLDVVAFVVIAATIFLVVRAARGRFSQSASLSPEGPRPPSDFFAEADRLAAKGDRVGAIRALCAGVAATLAGERSWEGSPLTVREIFQRAPDYPSLRPLLAPFEAAVYGGRPVDQDTYERAAQVAAPFRQSLVEKAA